MEKLPRLKILPLEDVILHEEFSPERVDRLSKRIVNDSHQKNPVIVARIKGIGKYMVLDGATRTTALTKLGFRDILAQVVDYYNSSITLDTWHHLIPSQGHREFFKEVSGKLGIVCEYTNLQKAQFLLYKRKILSYFLFFDNTCMTIRDESGKPSEEVRKLRELVHKCENLGKISRIHYSELGENLKKGGITYMANIFPSFSKEELIRFAQSKLRLPAGITRHIVPGRVLGFGIETAFLKDRKTPLYEKNKILKEIVDKRIIENGMRFYPESVFIFDD